MKRRFIDPNIQQKIIDEYLTGDISITRLSKKYSVTVYKIIRMLRDNNIKIINKSIIPKISDSIGSYILEEYSNKKRSLSNLSKELNISIVVISKYLKSKGIEIINFQNISRFNQHIFDKIDNEEKAYWLGFIFADGYISSTRYVFELSLSEKDINHLVKFNKFMEYSGNNIKRSLVKFKGKFFGRCRWGVTNKHLWNTLKDLGCIPQKSNKLEFPTKIPKEYMPDFIRGYFDGDGCITGNKKSINTTILGTEKFLIGLKNQLESIDPNFSSTIIEDKRMKFTKILKIYKKSLMSFFNIIYKNSKICLSRKYERFITLMNIQPSN